MNAAINPIHKAWLEWEDIMRKNFPDEVWAMIGKRMQGSFYAGALTILQDAQTRESAWSACEAGMADAMGIRTGIKMIDTRKEPVIHTAQT